MSSPRKCTVCVRGMCPIGTWSLISWIFTSWNLTNLDPRVCGNRSPPGTVGLSKMGMYVLPVTSWYTSKPLLSQVYAATEIIGLTS